MLRTLQTPGTSVAERDFNLVYHANQRGDFMMFGNSLITCPDSDSSCSSGRQGTGPKLANNNYSPPFQYIDIDGDSTTFDSSSASLNLPAGSTVTWAGLYWGARSSNAARGTVKLKTPGGNYQTINAARVDGVAYSGSVDQYQGYADITNIVKASESGQYTVANVQGDLNDTDGNNIYASWAIVVVYQDTTSDFRNFAVYDGLKVISSGQTGILYITLNGFTTPLTGNVRTKLGMLVYEGDKGMTGDSITLNNQAISNALNPADDFFNSSITNLAQNVTTRNPAYVDTMAMDLDVVDVSGFIGNGENTATFAYRTNGDGYFPGVFVLANDIYSPEIDLTLTQNDVNAGNLEPGDEIEYTLNIKNSGVDTANEVVINNVIPANTTYVPGSLSVAGTNYTDTKADDLAEIDAAANKVIFRVGTSASATTGGQLTQNATAQIKFKVKVNSGTSDGSIITNVGNTTFKSATTGATLQAISNEVQMPVVVPAASSSSSSSSSETSTSSSSSSSSESSSSVSSESSSSTVSESSSSSVSTSTDSSSSTSTTSSVPSSDPSSSSMSSTVASSTSSAGAGQLPDTGLFDDGSGLIVAGGGLIVIGLLWMRVWNALFAYDPAKYERSTERHVQTKRTQT